MRYALIPNQLLHVKLPLDEYSLLQIYQFATLTLILISRQDFDQILAYDFFAGLTQFL